MQAVMLPVPCPASFVSARVSQDCRGRVGFKTRLLRWRRILLPSVLALDLAHWFPVAATEFTWKGTVSGNWTDSQNWQPNTGTPGAGDNVLYDASIPFSNAPTNASGEVNNLTMNGDVTLGLSGLTVKGTFEFNGAHLQNGTLTIFGGATMNCGAAGSSTAKDSLSNCTLNNSGTVNAVNYGLAFYGCTFNNAGTFKLGNQTLGSFPGLNVFNNSGTLETAPGATLGILNVPFINTGSVHAKTGELRFLLAVNNSSDFLADAGATNHFTGATTNTAGASFSGDGLAVVENNNFFVNATVPASNLELRAGGLRGAGTLNISSNFTWASGQIQTLTVHTLGGCQSLVPSTAASEVQISGATFQNSGTFDWKGTDIGGDQGAMFLNDGTFAIHHGGSFKFANFGSGATILFTNAPGGLVQKTNDVSASPATISVPFNSGGTLEVNAGTLRLSGGGTNTATFTVKDNLEFRGTYLLANDSTMGGNTNGIVRFIGPGIVTARGGYDFPGLTSVEGSSVTADFRHYLGMSQSSARLALSSGTLAANTTFNVSTNFDWSGSTLTGTGSVNVAVSATLNIFGAGTHYLDSPVALLHAGRGTWSDNSTWNFSGAGGATFSNLTTATFTMLNNGTINGNGQFHNFGTTTKSNATGTTTIDSNIKFENYATGKLQVRSGAVWLNYAGTNFGGNFDVSDGKDLSFRGSGYTLNAGSTISGQGYATIVGTVIVAGDSAAQNLALQGTLGGGAAMSISEKMLWTSGTLDNTGAVNIASTATLTISNSASKSIQGKTLNNDGTVLWYDTGNIVFYAPSVIINGVTNLPGATFEARGHASITADTALHNYGKFHNYALFQKTTDTNETTVSYGVSLTNYSNGTIRAAAGLLTITGGGVNNGGTVRAETNCTIRFYGDPFLFGTNSSLPGDGFVRLQGQEQITGATVAKNLAVEINADVSGAGGLEITRQFDFLAGTLRGAGLLTIDSGAALNLASTSDKNLQRNALNHGTTTWTNTGNFNLSSSAGFTNAADGAFEIANNSTLNGSASSPFINQGLLRKTNSTGTNSFTAPLTTSGQFVLKSGGVNFSGGFTETAGTATLDGGNLVVNPPARIVGGEFNGNGPIYGSVSNSAAFKPGLSPGLITISGNYTQSVSGQLFVELGGLIGGTNYDQLRIAGSAALAGELILSLTNGFTPAVSNSFTIATFASRSGTFGSIVGAHPGGGVVLVTRYSSTNVTVLAAQDVQIQSVTKDGGGVHFSVPTTWGLNYTVEYADSLTPPIVWQPLTSFPGDGTVMSITDPAPSAAQRFYRVLIQ